MLVEKFPKTQILFKFIKTYTFHIVRLSSSDRTAQGKFHNVNISVSFIIFVLIDRSF